MENSFGGLKVKMFYGKEFENINKFIRELKKYIIYIITTMTEHL